jgi:hypothetical protein
LSKLGFEFTLFCHPELVSGSPIALFYEMLNQVQDVAVISRCPLPAGEREGVRGHKMLEENFQI